VEQNHVINYLHFLESKSQRTGVRKIEQTRERLKAGAVRLLERHSYHDIRIATFCEEADVAKGTFYLHFKDKEDIVAQVLAEYADLQVKFIPSVEQLDNAFDALSHLNTWFASTFYENLGVQRSMMQLSETIPRMTDIWTDFLKRLAERYIDEIARWSDKKLSDDVAKLIVYCLWGMLDQALYAIYAVKRNPDFGRVTKNRRFLVEAVTLFQYRALFLENPRGGIDSAFGDFMKQRLVE
jgi:AcrR family transcriptional regulator